MFRLVTRGAGWGTITILLVLAVGCGSDSSAGLVEGVVTINGKPAGGISVSFMPDPGKGMKGPSAVAVTDDTGHYRLEYTVVNDRDPSDSRRLVGAPPGWYKVVLDDFKMYDEHLKPPGRVPDQYTQYEQTPFVFEVKLGPQTIELPLTKSK